MAVQTARDLVRDVADVHRPQAAACRDQSFLSRIGRDHGRRVVWNAQFSIGVSDVMETETALLLLRALSRHDDVPGARDGHAVPIRRAGETPNLFSKPQVP